MKRSRRKDWRSGFLFSPCEDCRTRECLLTGEPCAAVEAQLECKTHTEGDAGMQAERWGDMEGAERFANGAILGIWGVRTMAGTERTQEMLAETLRRAILGASELGIEMHEPEPDGADPADRVRSVKFTLTVTPEEDANGNRMALGIPQGRE